jgi:hypothetical protein
MPPKKNHYNSLKEKLIKRHEDVKTRIWDKHAVPMTELAQNAKQMALGSMGGLMLLTSTIGPSVSLPEHHIIEEVAPIDLQKEVFFTGDLNVLLPDEVRPLTQEEEKNAAILLTDHFGIKVSAELENKRLNRSYGYIGAEQHLARYPGDTMESHFDDQSDADKYWSSGMAPGLGAWGYFVPAGQQMSEIDVQREKYYIAVQTFLSPDFNGRIREYRDFYKFRKMLVVNPTNGKAIVAVVGDAGPAQWTGKSLGGSPEVMKYLERVDGRAKGPVLYFFVDDPTDSIPLGPVQDPLEKKEMQKNALEN